jgi:DNA primase
MALSDSQKRYLGRACQEYEAQLGKIDPKSDHSGAIDYFRSHSVTFEMAQKYRLGYVADPIDGDERFAGRICIPYLSQVGPVAVNYRGLGDLKPKYLKPHGQKARLYNTPAYFAASDTIGLAEGEIDALVATEHLGIPTMGVPGATNFDQLWLPLFKDFQRVVIFADGDEAGATFARETAELIGWRARIVTCSPGNDVASMIANGEIASLKQLATGGRNG